MVSVIFKFKDADDRTVNVIIDDVNPLLDPSDVIDAANAIAANPDYRPYGSSLASLSGVKVVDKIVTSLEV